MWLDLVVVLCDHVDAFAILGIVYVLVFTAYPFSYAISSLCMRECTMFIATYDDFFNAFGRVFNAVGVHVFGSELCVAHFIVSVHFFIKF